MEALTFAAMVLIAVLALGALAAVFGADSRDDGDRDRTADPRLRTTDGIR